MGRFLAQGFEPGKFTVSFYLSFLSSLPHHVRRAFLCGSDSVTGFSFEHHRQRIVDRIKRGYISSKAPPILLWLKMGAAPVLDCLAKDVTIHKNLFKFWKTTDSGLFEGDWLHAKRKWGRLDIVTR